MARRQRRPQKPLKCDRCGHSGSGTLIMLSIDGGITPAPMWGWLCEPCGARWRAAGYRPAYLWQYVTWVTDGIREDEQRGT